MIEDTEYYQIWLERARLEETTKVKYRSPLGKFDEFLVTVHSVTATEFNIDSFWTDADKNYSYPMDKSFIEEYVEWLEDDYEDRSPSMPPQCFRAVKSFFSTLKNNGVIGVDPTVGAIGPAFYRSPKGLSLTHGELERLINAAFTKDPFSRKYVAMVLLLAGAGLRNRELRFLRVNRLDFLRSIALIDEGQKTFAATVSLTTLMKDALRHYLQSPMYVALSNKFDNGLLFMREDGGKLRSAELVDIISDLAVDAGIQKRVTPHTLRRTFATEMYRAGVDPEVMRRAMRHKLLDTTTGSYVNPDTEEDRQALDSFSMTRRLARLAERYIGLTSSPVPWARR